MKQSCMHTWLLILAGVTAPRLPRSVRETSITSSSATIQWMLTDPYNPSQPETFVAFYGVTSGQLNMSTTGVTANPTSQTYSTQLNSLQPGTEYFYRIESRNSHSSIFTDILSFMSMDRSKYEYICHNHVRDFTCFTGSSGVTSLERRTVNDTTLIISWEPPANPNGRFLSYSISIINLNDGSILRQENTVSISVVQADLGMYTMLINNYVILFLNKCFSSWSPLQCEYCSSEQCRSRRVQCVHSLHKGTRYKEQYYHTARLTI